MEMEMGYRRAAAIAARILENEMKEKYPGVIKDISLDNEMSLDCLSKSKEVTKLKQNFKTLRHVESFVKNDKKIPILAKKIMLGVEECKEFYVFLYSRM